MIIGFFIVIALFSLGIHDCFAHTRLQRMLEGDDVRRLFGHVRRTCHGTNFIWVGNSGFQ